MVKGNVQYKDLGLPPTATLTLTFTWSYGTTLKASTSSTPGCPDSLVLQMCKCNGMVI